MEMDDFQDPTVMGMAFFFYIILLIYCWKFYFPKITYGSWQSEMIVNWGTTIIMLPLTWLICAIIVNKD